MCSPDFFKDAIISMNINSQNDIYDESQMLWQIIFKVSNKTFIGDADILFISEKEIIEKQLSKKIIRQRNHNRRKYNIIYLKHNKYILSKTFIHYLPFKYTNGLCKNYNITNQEIFFHLRTTLPKQKGSIIATKELNAHTNDRLNILYILQMIYKQMDKKIKYNIIYAYFRDKELYNQFINLSMIHPSQISSHITKIETQDIYLTKRLNDICEEYNNVNKNREDRSVWLQDSLNWYEEPDELLGKE